MRNYAALHYYIALKLSILGYYDHSIIIVYRPSPVPSIQSQLRYIYTEAKPGQKRRIPALTRAVSPPKPYRSQLSLQSAMEQQSPWVQRPLSYSSR